MRTMPNTHLDQSIIVHENDVGCILRHTPRAYLCFSFSFLVFFSLVLVLLIYFVALLKF